MRLSRKTIAIIFLVMINIMALFAEEQLQKVVIKTTAQCEKCKARIEKAIKRLDGVAKVNLDVDSKELSITFNPLETNVLKLQKNVSNTGYDADSIKANPKAYNNLPECCKLDGHK